MVYLAINCGYGNSDIATLPSRYIDLRTNWISYPRPKTSVPRKAKLWDETRIALETAMATRPAAAKSEFEGLVFLTPTGLPFVRSSLEIDDQGQTTISQIDEITKAFRRLLKRLGIHRKGLSFYSLRHTAETYAGADQVATDVLMGHVTPGMSSNYRHGIAEARMEGVAANLHSWLFGKECESHLPFSKVK
jgi:integrase